MIERWLVYSICFFSWWENYRYWRVGSRNQTNVDWKYGTAFLKWWRLLIVSKNEHTWLVSLDNCASMMDNLMNSRHWSLCKRLCGLQHTGNQPQWPNDPFKSFTDSSFERLACVSFQVRSTTCKSLFVTTFQISQCDCLFWKMTEHPIWYIFRFLTVQI